MSVQPIERNTVNFQLYFEVEDKYYDIDKPIDIEKADFEIKQNSNGYGRYLTFADSINIGFSPRLNHEFKRLCNYYKQFKWQTGIYIILNIDGNEFYRGRFKLETAETDFTYSFKCQVDVNNLREVIESKKSENIDLTTTKSIDNKEITKIELVPVLTKLKEIFISNVAYLEDINPVYIGYVVRYEMNIFNKKGFGNSALVQGSKFLSIDTLELNDSTRYVNGNAVAYLTVDIKDIDVTFIFDRNLKIYFYKTIHNSDGTVDSEELMAFWQKTGDINCKISNIHNVTLAPNQILRYRFRFENLSPTGDKPKGWIIFNKKASLNIMSIDKFGDTTTQCSRLIDNGKQIIKSITSGKGEIIAPKFTEPDGQFYDLYATSGLFLRQFDNQPYYSSWKAFTEYLKNSFNCDVQVNGNKIFIGHETDFYKNIEMERIPFEPNKDSFKVSANQRLVKNSFIIGYSKFEDDKDSSNTIDSIHVKSEWYLPGSQPINDAKDELTINYVVDQYKIENIRRESFNKDATKTVPNDKDVYIIDTITKDNKLQNRSNEGMAVSNLYSPQTSYNLRLSTKRLTLDYFSEFLANSAQFGSDDVAWKNTVYLNNKIAETKPIMPLSVKTKPLKVVEGDDIKRVELPSPYLSGYLYDFGLSFRVKFNEFISLAKKIIDDAGYITFYTDQTEIKIHISSLKYNWESEKIYNIKGEQRL